ncbi:hypothetical protein DM02DRAFT_310701 [Periconia macrospinosa]|uniref:Peptidase A2 domain-containing protein n=1 Tax=Periconia macrospinosa TaxID=97972 RepID=A0A2V1DZB3_9PLEO|nr:hypothetical protein DM02DRAFT_310701 [Periconia macrospinosa]
MADPLSLVVVLATLVNTTASLAAIGKSFAHTIPEFERQIAEIDVLLLILEETTKTFVEYGTLPRSVEAATRRCEACYNELEELIKQHWVKGRKGAAAKIRKRLRLVYTEDVRRAAYHAFRDSVLLLRDLASDARIQRQLSEMSSGLLELLDTELDEESVIEEPENEETSGKPSRPRPNHTAWDPLAYAEQHGDSSDTASKERQKRAVKPMMHAKSNFTMGVTLVHQHQGLSYIPVRGKMDTGCDYNLISTDIVERAKIPDDRIEILKKEIPLNGLEGTKYTLKKRIQFTWYLNRSMKSRIGDFYLVGDDSFDVILGANFWGGSESKSALFLQRPGKSSAEKQKEKNDHEANINTARAAKEKQKMETLEARLRQRQPPTIPVPNSLPPSTMPNGSAQVGAPLQSGTPNANGAQGTSTLPSITQNSPPTAPNLAPTAQNPHSTAQNASP